MILLSNKISGGILGNADFTAGLDISSDENALLGEDGKIYPTTLNDSTLFSTFATIYDDQSPFKTVEVSTDNLVLIGSIDSSERNGFVFGATLSGNLPTNQDVEALIWDESVQTQPFRNFDITTIASGTDQFAVAINGQGISLGQPFILFGDFDGASFNLGTLFQNTFSLASNFIFPSIVDLGINGGDNESVVIVYRSNTSTSIGVWPFKNVIGNNVASISAAAFDSTASSNRPANFKAPVSKLTTLRLVAGSSPDLDGGFHAIHFISNTASINVVDLDTTRTLSGRLPIGVFANSATEILVAAISGFSFFEDQQGLTGVTNPINTTSGQVLSIYAIETSADYTSTVDIGISEKLDPIIAEQNNGLTPIHIIKDQDGNFNIIYNGFVHKVSVDFSTQTVTKIFTGADKRHDSSVLTENNFSGSTFNGSSQSITSINEIAGNRVVYSDNTQSSGAIQVFPKQFFSAGTRMPIGQAQAAITKDAVGTIRLDSRVISKDTGGTYTPGEISNRITSSNNKNLTVTANRALTTSVIAVDIPEFEKVEDNFTLADCARVDLREFGLVLDSLSPSRTEAVYSLTISLNGIVPLFNFLQINNPGFIEFLSFINLTSPQNVPDWDVIIDGEIFSQQRNESNHTNTEAVIIGSGATTGAITSAANAESIIVRKSVILKSRNIENNAVSENISMKIRFSQRIR